MLQFTTKQEYWQIEDSGILKQLPVKFPWHLKSIQDAAVFQEIHQSQGKKIAEIGGGDSRIIPVISQQNECYNIEEFKGYGNGPKGEIVVDKVKNISTMVGTYSELLSENFFDIIFSVSVVEHVPTGMLEDFFRDCHRILKPQGTMIHAIDLYIEDDPVQNRGAIIRVEEYRQAFLNNLFEPLTSLEQLITKEDVKFSTAFATNPDPTMRTWNNLSPELTQKRIDAQSCTMLMMGKKK